MIQKLNPTITKDPLVVHVDRLLECHRCPLMQSAPVSGGPVYSEVLLVGQAPGVKEPELKKPFAWTAGKTMFRWFREYCDVSEEDFRTKVYMAAVCRCFPGKNPKGGDRVPTQEEIENCSYWLEREFDLLQPKLVLAVGKLAIMQFITFERLIEVIGSVRHTERFGKKFDLIALPHPSGASTWHRTEPGKTLLQTALQNICKHPAFQRTFARNQAPHTS